MKKLNRWIKISSVAIAATVAVAVFSACSDDSSDSDVFNSLETVRESDFVSTIGSSTAPDKEEHVEEADLSFRVISISPASSGSRADSLIAPRFVESSPEGSFLVRATHEFADAASAISLSLPHLGRDIPLEFQRVEEGVILKPMNALIPGETYRIHVQRGAASAKRETKLEADAVLDVYIPHAGVMKVLEAGFTDQHLRVVVSESNQLQFLPKSGKPQYLPVTSVSKIRDAFAADIDRDGRTDLVVLGTRVGGGSAISWLRNVSKGLSLSFEESSLLLKSLAVPTSLAMLTVGREEMDLLVGGFDGELYLLDHDRILKSARTQGVEYQPELTSLRTSSDVPVGILEILVKDLQPDGIEEVILTTTEGVKVLFFDAEGNQAADSIVSIPDSTGMQVVGCTDGDNRELLLLRAKTAYRASIDEAKSDSGAREASVAKKLLDGLSTGTQLTFADIDGDAVLDALGAYSSSPNAVVRKFTSILKDPSDAGGVRVRSAGKVNSIQFSRASDSVLLCCVEGLLEVSLQEERELEINFDCPVFFHAPEVVASFPAMDKRVLTDLNGDGRLDVAGLYEKNGTRLVGTWINRLRVDGTFEEGESRYAEPFADLVALDINRDQLADLLLLPRDSSQPGMLLRSIGNGSFKDDRDIGFLANMPDNVSGTPLLADFNDDGYDDMFWPTTSGGSMSYSDRSRMNVSDAYTLRTFTGSREGEVFSHTGSAVIGDFISNGKQDIVAAGTLDGSARLMLYQNTMDRARWDVNRMIPRMLAGSFDALGTVVSGRFVGGELGVMALVLDEGRWKLMLWDNVYVRAPRAVWEFGERSSAPLHLQSVDVDLDGDEDIALQEFEFDSSLLLLVNRGDGLLSNDTIASEALRHLAGDSAIRDGRLVDLTGDSRPDLLTHSEDGDVHHAANE